MAKLDRLGWAGGASFSAYGRLIGIRVSDRDALSLVPSRLPFGWNPSAKRKVDHLYSLILGGPGAATGVRRFNLLYAGSVRVARSLDPVEVLDALESDLHRYVAQTSRRHVFVHAGAVGWRGRAIVIPGASMSGKTTLVSAFVQAGATYYSDEYAVLDRKVRYVPTSSLCRSGRCPLRAPSNIPSRRSVGSPERSRSRSGGFSSRDTAKARAGGPACSPLGMPCSSFWQGRCPYASVREPSWRRCGVRSSMPARSRAPEERRKRSFNQSSGIALFEPKPA